MGYTKLIVRLACITLTIAVNTSAGVLEKRHYLGIRIGMWSQVADTRTEIGAGLISTTVENSGYMGGVAYGHWLTEGLALNIHVGGVSADMEARVGLLGVSTETAYVGHILVGIKQYFPKSTFSSSVRPFARALIGPFIGSQTRTEVGLVVATESRSESALGGQAAVGLDFVLSRHFLAGMALGYNLMSDFGEPIGGSENYSGPEFSLGFGYLFGKGSD